MTDPTLPGYLSPAQIKIEALNLASRESVARAYENKPTLEIAREMVNFINEE